ncbi:MAG: hypothetical protein ABI237_08575, partial [Ginsengibacter sp.]
FALMQKKQKIKDNPTAPRVCPGQLHRDSQMNSTLSKSNKIIVILSKIWDLFFNSFYNTNQTINRYQELISFKFMILLDIFSKPYVNKIIA